jgi:uncharacterized protein YrrD
MQIRNGASVVTADGEEVGQVDRVVMDPRSRQITHIVVRRGLLLAEDKVFPVDGVDEANENEVRLTPEISDLESFPSYIDVEFVPLEESEQERTGYPAAGAPPVYWYPTGGMGPMWSTGYYGPYPVPGDQRLKIETNIPEGTLALEEGARVISSNGENVGSIREIGIDADSNLALYFILERGFFNKEQRLIPMYWVDRIEEEQVYLIVSEKFIDNLPEHE